MKRPRVLLADDHPLVLAGLRTLLEAECEVVEVVSDGRLLVEAASRLQREVIILDISLPLLNGIGPSDQTGAARNKDSVSYDSRQSCIPEGCPCRWRLRVPAEDHRWRRVAGRRAGRHQEPNPREPGL